MNFSINTCCNGYGCSRELVNWFRNMPDGEPMPENHYCDCTMGVMRAYFDMHLVEINKRYNGFKPWYFAQLDHVKIETDWYLGLEK